MQPNAPYFKKVLKRKSCFFPNGLNPIRPGGGSEAQMTKLTADNQKPLTL